MPVPNLPFWLSAANTEFTANGWASNIMSKAGVAVPGNLSSLAGRSAASIFTMNVGSWEPAQNDIERGFTLGQAGSITPAQYKGITFRGLYATNYDNNVYLWFDGSTPAMTLTIAGAGSVSIRANTGSSPFGTAWSGLYSWLSGKEGQNVQVTLS